MPPTRTRTRTSSSSRRARPTTSSTRAARTTRTSSSSSSSAAARARRRDPAFKAAVADLVAKLGPSDAPLDGVQTPTFSQLADPFTAPPAAGLDRRRRDRPSGSPGGSRAIRGTGSAAHRAGPADPRRPRGRRTRRSPSTPSAARSSTQDINELISKGSTRRSSLTIPLTFIILLFAFGAIVASVVPLVLAITSLVAAFGILGIYSQVVGPVSPNATQLIVLIGLAVAVDYSLFMITRFRVERRAGRDRAKAIEVSSSTAGRAVFFSGLAVMISLAGLITLGVSLFTSMAIGTISVVFVSVVGSLTFLPATLAILGDRVNLGRPATWLPRLAVALPLGPVSRWGRSALDWLDRRAAQAGRQRVLGPPRDVGHGPARPDDRRCRSGVLLLLASPVLGLRTGITDITAFPDSIDGVAGIKLLNEKWPQGTDSTSRSSSPTPTGPTRRPPSSASRPRASKIDGLNEPVEVTPSHDGKVALVAFTMGGNRNDDAEPGDRPPGPEPSSTRPSSAGLPDVRTYVTGDAGVHGRRHRRSTPTGSRSSSRFVLGLSFLLMLVAFHSIVIPIKAIILNLLSVAAAYGVLVPRLRARLVRRAARDHAERGHRELGPAVHLHDPVRPVDGLPPVHPDPDQGGAGSRPGSRAAVAKGISVTLGVITSAASIMVVVFAVFVTLQVRVHPAARARARGRRVHRRDDHPERPAAGLDDAARRLELVDAAVPRLDPAGDHRGRPGRTGRARPTASSTARPAPRRDRAVGAIGEVFAGRARARADVVRRPDRPHRLLPARVRHAARLARRDRVRRPRRRCASSCRARRAASSASRSGRAGPGWPAASPPGSGFTLPSAIALTVARPRRGLDRPSGAGWVHGLKLAAVAVVAQAVWVDGREPDAGLAATGRGASRRRRVALAWTTPFSQVAIIAAGARHRPVAARAPAGRRRPGPSRARSRGGSALVALAVFGAAARRPAAPPRRRRPAGRPGRRVLPVGRAGVRRRPRRPAAAAHARSSTRAGCPTASSSPATAPRRRCRAALHVRGVPRAPSPAPSPNGVAGAAIAIVAIFLPSFLLIFGALPFWDRLRGVGRRPAGPHRHERGGRRASCSRRSTRRSGPARSTAPADVAVAAGGARAAADRPGAADRRGRAVRAGRARSWRPV